MCLVSESAGGRMDSMGRRYLILLYKTYGREVRDGYLSKKELLEPEGKHTFDLEEGGQELELVLLGGNGVRQLLAVVKRLQKGLKAVVYQRHLVGHHDQDIYRASTLSKWPGKVLRGRNVGFAMPPAKKSPAAIRLEWGR